MVQTRHRKLSIPVSAEECEIPNLVDVPTGLGKTAMAILGRRGGGIVHFGLRNYVFKRGYAYGRSTYI
jgi:hypothetical protein